MLTVKTGVQPKLIYLLVAVANEAAKLPFDVTITAGIDGVHDPNSKHYMLAAIDVRSQNFPTREAKTAFKDAVLTRLGVGYVGIFEDEGTANEHLHFQWR